MLVLYFSIWVVACEKQTVEQPLPTITVSKLVTKNDKTYLEVNGVPFPIQGAQIRLDALINCDKKNIEEVEPYFEKARDLCINCVQIPIWWKSIEPKKNEYTFTMVDKILEYANKYNLKIELLWFSTNMIGDSFSYLVPNYILSDPDKRLARDNEGAFWDYYGYVYALILDDEWILQRETKALKELFNHIRQWDIENGEKHPVITVQIHNEPDGFARWRYEQQHYHYRDGRPFSKQDAWKMSLNALNALGKAVKESPYRVVTRTNLVTRNGIDDFPQVPGANPLDVFNLDGIDFISYDPYDSMVNVIKNNSLAFGSINGNYPLIAENKGTYHNTASLILVAAALGSGYDIYDLATSKFFIDHTTPDFADKIDHGIYTWDLREKTHTSKVRAIIKGLVAAFPDVAKIETEDFLVFNVRSDHPETTLSQTINSTKIRFTFSTSKGALAFAITTPDYILIYSTETAKFELSNGSFSDVMTGSFDKNGVFISSGDAMLENGTILNAEKEILYKISYNSFGVLNSTSIDEIGY